MVEDDDDITFGDFSFAHHQIDGPGFSSSPFPNLLLHNNDKEEEDDDDWGDFVESPLRSNLSSNGPTTTGPSPNWVKPKCALPLSLFGQEEEEQSSAADPTQHSADLGLNGSQNSAFTFNYDVIHTFYNQTQAKKEGENNGFGSDSSNVLNLEKPGFEKDSNFDLFTGSYVEKFKGATGLSSKSEFLDGNRVEKENGSGSGSDFDFFAGSSVLRSNQVEKLSGLSLDSDLFAVKSDDQSPQMMDFSGSSFNSNTFAKKNNGHTRTVSDGHTQTVSELSSDRDFFMRNNDSQDQRGVNREKSLSLGSSGDMFLFTQKVDFDMSSALDSRRPQYNGGHSPVTNLEENAGTSNLAGLNSNLDEIILNLDAPYGNEAVDADDDDDDDDGWEFKDASTGWKTGDWNANKVHSNDQGNYKVNGSHESVDFSSASNGISVKSTEVDLSFEFPPLAVAQDGFSMERVHAIAQDGMSSDSFFNNSQSGVEPGLDSNECYGDFQDAFSGNGFKEEGNETRPNNHKAALPLAFFGDEELETDDSSNAQVDFIYKPASTPRDAINNGGSNSIHDLISNLYNQPQQVPSVETSENYDEDGPNLNPLDEVLPHIPENVDDEFDDDSWDFKDASAQPHALENDSTKLELNSLLDFYCKLKDELSYVCRCHLENLKKAQNSAVLSGEEANIVAVEEKIQEACNELRKQKLFFEDHSNDQPQRDISLNEFLEALHEPKFQVLELKHQLSRKLLSAEKDLTSALGAVKHATAMLNVLTLGSVEDQFNYVSAWYKVISVCAQELKHGSWIWKQSLQKNLHSWMISEPRGKDYILSLGEIYRVVVILRTSTTLYDPWILSSASYCTSIFSLLEECYTLWSSSGIEETLQALADTIDKDYQSTAKTLLGSIKHVHELDELALQHHGFNQQGSTCQISLLTADVVPEMKLVIWNGETYFVTLANLWANLVSCDPPVLPRLDVGLRDSSVA